MSFCNSTEYSFKVNSVFSERYNERVFGVINSWLSLCPLSHNLLYNISSSTKSRHKILAYDDYYIMLDADLWKKKYIYVLINVEILQRILRVSIKTHYIFSQNNIHNIYVIVLLHARASITFESYKLNVIIVSSLALHLFNSGF